MAEIEIGVVVGQRLDRRIADKIMLTSEVAHWNAQRNSDGATINWLFTVEKARVKLGRSYPVLPLSIFKRVDPLALRLAA